MTKLAEHTEDLLCQNFTSTFQILGRKWNGLIIETLLISGPKRFLEISRAIPVCSDRVLVERLKELESEHLINRVTYEDSSLTEYKLTPAGEAMRPMMAAVHEWSDKYNNVKQTKNNDTDSIA